MLVNQKALSKKTSKLYLSQFKGKNKCKNRNQKNKKQK